VKVGVVWRWSIFVASLFSVAASAAQVGICDLARQRDGLYPYMVEGQANADGVVEIPADGSGVAGRLSWFRTGSSSIVPADYDRVTLTLSSNGKVFMVEDQRVLLARYRRKFYVVATSLSSDTGPWKRVVYSVERKGIPKLCAFGGKGIGP
jgi:hypothetical protein